MYIFNIYLHVPPYFKIPIAPQGRDALVRVTLRSWKTAGEGDQWMAPWTQRDVEEHTTLQESCLIHSLPCSESFRIGLR